MSEVFGMPVRVAEAGEIERARSEGVKVVGADGGVRVVAYHFGSIVYVSHMLSLCEKGVLNDGRA